MQFKIGQAVKIDMDKVEKSGLRQESPQSFRLLEQIIVSSKKTGGAFYIREIMEPHGYTISSAMDNSMITTYVSKYWIEAR